MKKMIDIFIERQVSTSTDKWELASVKPCFRFHFTKSEQPHVHIDPLTGDETLVGTKDQLEKWELEAYLAQCEEEEQDPDQAYEQYLERGDDESRADLDLHDYLFPYGYNEDPRNPGVNGEGLLNAPDSLITQLTRLGWDPFRAAG